MRSFGVLAQLPPKLLNPTCQDIWSHSSDSVEFTQTFHQEGTESSLKTTKTMCHVTWPSFKLQKQQFNIMSTTETRGNREMWQLGSSYRLIGVTIGKKDSFSGSGAWEHVAPFSLIARERMFFFLLFLAAPFHPMAWSDKVTVHIHEYGAKI